MCCSRTSPPVRSTRRPALRCSPSSGRSWTPRVRRSSWSPTTRARRPTPTGLSFSPTERLSRRSIRRPPRPSPIAWPDWGADRMLSVALQGLRGRKGPFAGAFIALAVAAALVMACATLLQAGLTSKPPVERYAGAPLVVSGEQTSRINVGKDSKGSVPLYERVRVPSALAPRVASVPGVAHAIADVSVLAQLEGSQGPIAGPTGHPILLHPWSTAALTPYALQDGHAPSRQGDVVIDAGLARRGHVAVGSTLQLAANGPARPVRVVGIAKPSAVITRQAAVFATTAAVQHLAALGGRVDAIGILPARG